jgi:hypothetical protein
MARHRDRRWHQNRLQLATFEAFHTDGGLAARFTHFQTFHRCRTVTKGESLDSPRPVPPMRVLAGLTPTFFQDSNGSTTAMPGRRADRGRIPYAIIRTSFMIELLRT